MEDDDDEEVETADGGPAEAAAIDEAGPRDSDEQAGTTGTATPKS